MKKALVLSTLAAAAGLAAVPASAMDILARVISSTPVVQQVAVPRQVCSNQPVITQAPNSGAGALMGASRAALPVTPSAMAAAVRWPR
jgi:uncharacterized protein YcfJ